MLRYLIMLCLIMPAGLSHAQTLDVSTTIWKDGGVRNESGIYQYDNGVFIQTDEAYIARLIFVSKPHPEAPTTWVWIRVYMRFPRPFMDTMGPKAFISRRGEHAEYQVLNATAEVLDSGQLKISASLEGEISNEIPADTPEVIRRVFEPFYPILDRPIAITMQFSDIVVEPTIAIKDLADPGDIAIQGWTLPEWLH